MTSSSRVCRLRMCPEPDMVTIIYIGISYRDITAANTGRRQTSHRPRSERRGCVAAAARGQEDRAADDGRWGPDNGDASSLFGGTQPEQEEAKTPSAKPNGTIGQDGTVHLGPRRWRR
ncbi:hypothetical protein CH63R_13716 [Colletotrichum higginsianum IMI 349063]|uniref:Uncharacterized protein n=1 Tax=Colletotrichum higginsianum (strain IMI 349063) TaxID=759273 RepID=A0A1B7XRX2_COLHI|nr:hypothetical protein CH63R_13716 [Colletotrichum higginsianum IMI 349063]OBR02490.1 hypothetical protein CH63R_13716 [Colletotrichum higginsianum IMI 349063]